MAKGLNSVMERLMNARLMARKGLRVESSTSYYVVDSNAVGNSAELIHYGKFRSELGCNSANYESNSR